MSSRGKEVFFSERAQVKSVFSTLAKVDSKVSQPKGYEARYKLKRGCEEWLGDGPG